MRWLARHGYTPISVADWLAWLRDGKPLPERPVLLTFDDGYADITEHALPLLRTLGFTATVFVVTSQVGGTNWWDRAAGIAPQALMSAEEIRYWAAHGIEFGSHSRTHADLRTLAGPELEAELRGSRDELAAIIGKPVLSFAYPFGYVNDAVCRAAGEVFDAAFTCEEALNDPRTEPNRLGRANMTPRYAWLDPGCAVRFGFNPLVRIRMRAGLARRRLFCQ
jgi:peptidoglycan/xylan/chitin deacetylase (PgdA/CDA1 family)